MNETKPKPSEVIQATRAVTDSDFAQEFPETTKLEDHLKEYIRQLENKIRDCEKALQHALDAVDSIQKGKK